jgi:hypothetical protein
VLSLVLCKSLLSTAFVASLATVGCPGSERMSQKIAKVSGWSEAAEESRCGLAGAGIA